MFLSNRRLEVKMVREPKQLGPVTAQEEQSPFDPVAVADSVSEGVMSIIVVYMASDVVRKVLISHLAK